MDSALRILFFPLTALLLLACGASMTAPDASTPTAAAVPPSATPEPPTPTSIPPTATRLPPTATTTATLAPTAAPTETPVPWTIVHSLFNARSLGVFNNSSGGYQLADISTGPIVINGEFQL